MSSIGHEHVLALDSPISGAPITTGVRGQGYSVKKYQVAQSITAKIPTSSTSRPGDPAVMIAALTLDDLVVSAFELELV